MPWQPTGAYFLVSISSTTKDEFSFEGLARCSKSTTIVDKMTLSREDRVRNIELAIRLLMEELGEKAIGAMWTDPEDARYAGIYATTWPDLEQLDLIKPIHSAVKTWYQLTCDGWLKGLELTNTLEGTKEKVGRVMRELKKRVDGRKQRDFVFSGEIAIAAGVSDSFLENMIESDFIRSVFNQHSVIPEQQIPGYLFEIPINFGQEIL